MLQAIRLKIFLNMSQSLVKNLNVKKYYVFAISNFFACASKYLFAHCN